MQILDSGVIPADSGGKRTSDPMGTSRTLGESLDLPRL